MKLFAHILEVLSYINKHVLSLEHGQSDSVAPDQPAHLLTTYMFVALSEDCKDALADQKLYCLQKYGQRPLFCLTSHKYCLQLTQHQQYGTL